jgi:hypothetical protein
MTLLCIDCFHRDWVEDVIEGGETTGCDENLLDMEKDVFSRYKKKCDAYIKRGATLD